MFKSHVYLVGLFFVLSVLGNISFAHCAAGHCSYEGAINALQVEISNFEILKEEGVSARAACIPLACVSASLIFWSAFSGDPLVFTLVSAFACYIHRPYFMVAYYKKRVELLRKQIKRLKLEEIQPV